MIQEGTMKRLLKFTLILFLILVGFLALVPTPTAEIAGCVQIEGTTTWTLDANSGRMFHAQLPPSDSAYLPVLGNSISKRVLFRNPDNTNATLYLPTTNGFTKLSLPRFVSEVNMLWSPQDRYVIFEVGLDEQYTKLNYVLYDFREQKRLDLGTFRIRAFWWAPDEHYLMGTVDNGSNTSIIVWEFPSGRQVKTILNAEIPTSNNGWSPTGYRFVFMAHNGEQLHYALYDVTSDQVIDLFASNREGPLSVSWTDDTRYFAIDEDDYLMLFDQHGQQLNFNDNGNLFVNNLATLTWDRHRLIYIIHDSDLYKLRVYDADSQNLTTIYQDGKMFEAYLHNDREVISVYDETYMGAVFLVDIAGQHRTNLTFDSDPKILSDAHWIGDYVTPQDWNRKFNHVYWADADGSHIHKFDFPGPNTFDEVGFTEPLNDAVLVTASSLGGPPFYFFLLSLRDETLIPLPSGDGIQATRSPDGKWIGILGARSFTIYDVQGRAIRQYTLPPDQDFYYGFDWRSCTPILTDIHYIEISGAD
jgi:hypothetical protein